MNPGSMIREARIEADLTQAELASRSGTSQATLSAYEAGSKVPSAVTFARILAAAGRRMTTVPAARPVLPTSEEELQKRGDILIQVLELADALPHRRDGPLRYPPLHRLMGTG